ncbi:DeoR/GlpR family DNA-binding transcription regulator [Mangrovicella endophytica]|uniref:DeoR/GlpR family DNA-binding transcription regulator n=1 Tax=Mangrovicella endophytica TaxID=2066697 RepID=UPI000C9EB762|nr:DeoR/GlpR family DNA-binding transcription regulator [Mangrovicella endophytica]
MSQLLTRERQALIRDRLQDEGRVLAGELAKFFSVSEDTIRRDLREMAAAGLCERVYGGALRAAPQHGSLSHRQSVAADEKAMLAGAAAPLLKRGATVVIDAGSTNLAIAARISQGHRLTIVTNAPAIATAAGDRGADTILLGGRYDAATGGCLGARTAAEAAQLRPDLYVLGACGVDPAAGVTAFSQEEAELKRLLVGRSRAVLVAATADKLGTAASFGVADCDRLTHLVVGADCPAELAQAFSSRGVAVTQAGPQRRGAS